MIDHKQLACHKIIKFTKISDSSKFEGEQQFMSIVKYIWLQFNVQVLHTHIHTHIMPEYLPEYFQKEQNTTTIGALLD